MSRSSSINESSEPATGASRGLTAYATVWRLHFYAGLFCVPFILWLACTGSLYLFKPQIDAFIDRPYDSLEVHGAAKPPSEQVSAALGAVEGGVLNAYELPQSPRSASRVLVGRGSEVFRVYVQPETLDVLKIVPENNRFTRLLFYLHGELLLGRPGSITVELAASWAIVMILTGWYLWWPRDGRMASGVLYPRLGAHGRTFWRDLHSVAGFWVSLFTLFLLISGLPWAASWGTLLKTARQLASPTIVEQPWTTGSDDEAHLQELANRPPRAVHHHGGGGGTAMSADLGRQLDRLIGVVAPLQLAYPVLISPPSALQPTWTARSDAQNRPLRENLVLDGERGTVISRTAFAQWPLIDRLVGYGVAIHEGQMFGWLNQALGVFTAAGLLAATISGLVMWWKRRPSGQLGAPRAPRRLSGVPMLWVTLALLSLLFPFLGLSLLGVLAVDRWIFPRSPKLARFLGTTPAAAL